MTFLMVQVIALEEKTGRSTDYNRSPVTTFKTSKEKKVGLGMLVVVASSFRLSWPSL